MNEEVTTEEKKWFATLLSYAKGSFPLFKYVNDATIQNLKNLKLLAKPQGKRFTKSPKKIM